MEGITKKIRETIEILKHSDINGCITGSTMTGEDFDAWESVPDIDVFVYSREELMYSVAYLLGRGDFKYKSEGEEVKVGWMREGSFNKKFNVNTVKLVNGDVELNITYKNHCVSLHHVLATFDMSIIMIGYDIPRGLTLDLRTGTNCGAGKGESDKWSNSVKVAVPNPLRLVRDTQFDTAMATRQFDRVVKYWNRGFDTRPMARFYIDKIDAVIAKGAIFKTENSIEAYDQFVEEYSEKRKQIQEWLDDKEGVEL